MSSRVRYTATYDYPGLLFPETTTRDIENGDVVAAVAAAPDDGWYAVKIRAIAEKRFTADDGDETWVKTGAGRVVGFYVVGEKFHVDDDQIAGPDFDILRSNIRSNSKDGYAVKTRCGNWQIASDYDDVLPPQAVRA